MLRATVADGFSESVGAADARTRGVGKKKAPRTAAPEGSGVRAEAPHYGVAGGGGGSVCSVASR